MIIDFYCYTCDSSRCACVKEQMGTLVHEAVGASGHWRDGRVEVWRKPGTVHLRFYYDSDVCCVDFPIPEEVLLRSNKTAEAAPDMVIHFPWLDDKAEAGDDAF